MTREEVLHLANNLFNEALTAKYYWQIMQQFEQNTKEYHEEVNYSPAFYTIVFHALSESLFMNLSKLYDWNKDSLTLRTLLEETHNITVEDFDNDVKKTYDENGGKFHHQLSPSEESFFAQEVQEQKDIFALFGQNNHIASVDLSLQEMNKLFCDRFTRLKESGSIQNLIKRRNTVFAHNDTETNFDYEKAAGQYPVTENTIILLIDFAVECLQFYIDILSGTYKLAECLNIDDWLKTLQLVRMGTEYQEIQLKEFLEQE